MAPRHWIAASARFVRENPRRAAAAGTIFGALIVGIWRWGSQAEPRPAQPARAAGRENPSPDPAAALLKARPKLTVGDELCGYGPLPIRDGTPYVPDEIKTAATAAFARIADDLAARSDDRDRALGLRLQTVSASNAA